LPAFGISRSITNLGISVFVESSFSRFNSGKSTAIKNLLGRRKSSQPRRRVRDDEP
jgi:hypothetical protein